MKKECLTVLKPDTCSTRTIRSIEVRSTWLWRLGSEPACIKKTPILTNTFLVHQLRDWWYIEAFSLFLIFFVRVLLLIPFCAVGRVSAGTADCGNPSVPGAASGVFTSPKWPEKYERSSGLLSCSWHIQSAHDHRILLHFQAFSIEGELESELFLLLIRRVFVIFSSRSNFYFLSSMAVNRPELPLSSLGFPLSLSTYCHNCNSIIVKCYETYYDV